MYNMCAKIDDLLYECATKYRHSPVFIFMGSKQYCQLVKEANSMFGNKEYTDINKYRGVKIIRVYDTDFLCVG